MKSAIGTVIIFFVQKMQKKSIFPICHIGLPP